MRIRGRGLLALGTALGVAALFAACDESAPTEVDSDLPIEIANAKGGNGNGGNGGNNGNDPPPITLDMALTAGPTPGLYTTEQQAGGLGADTRNNLELRGRGLGEREEGECDWDPTTGPAVDDCFQSGIALQAGVTGGLASCSTNHTLGDSPANMQHLFNSFDSPVQDRWAFEVDIGKRKGDVFIRTFWYDSGDPQRRNVFVRSTGAVESPDGTWTITDGEVSASGTGDGILSCPWEGQFTITWEHAN